MGAKPIQTMMIVDTLKAFKMLILLKKRVMMREKNIRDKTALF